MLAPIASVWAALPSVSLKARNSASTEISSATRLFEPSIAP